MSCAHMQSSDRLRWHTFEEMMLFLRGMKELTQVKVDPEKVAYSTCQLS